MIAVTPLHMLCLLTCFVLPYIKGVTAALPHLDHVFNITVYLDPPSPPITALAGKVLCESFSHPLPLCELTA